MNIRQIPVPWLYTAVRVLSLCALFFAAMLAVDYYFVAHTFCEEGASCSVVAQSEFGQKYGIFLPTLGLVAYSFFFLTSFVFSRTKKRVFGKSLSKFWVPLAIICCAVGALLFIIVQATQIHAFCWLCMGIDTSGIVMVIPAVFLMMQQGTSSDREEASSLEVSQPTWLHPVLWVAFYLAIVCAPIAFGTRPVSAPQPQVAEGGDVVPAYIRSFYKPGKINVVEISSFDCPHCRKLHPELEPLLEKYGDQVNFTRLTIPLGKQKEACVAYYCAEKQKKEREFADCLFDKPSKDAGQLLEYARQCSVDEESFKSCLVDPASSAAIDEIVRNIREAGFQGAPTLWIDDVEIVGYNEKLGMQPYEDALSKNVRTDDGAVNATKVAFNVTLLGVICAVFCFLIGGVKTLLRRRPRGKQEA